MCVCVSVGAIEAMGVRFPGVGITGAFEPSHMGAGNGT